MGKGRRAILTIRERCPCPDGAAGGRSHVSFDLTADQKQTGSNPPRYSQADIDPISAG